MKKKKIKILELTILFIIILSFIIVSLFMKKILNNNPELSNSNEIENYSITSYYSYTLSLNNNIYKIPFLENTTNTNSFKIYLRSTDNIINIYQEEIIINYMPSINTYNNKVINYCNAYNDINSNYELICTYKNNQITLKNTFKLDYIYVDKLKTNNYELTLPIKKDTRLNEYLYQLKQKNISYNKVDSLSK